IYPGDTVPEFERAFAELKPMDVSPPVKTPFGWHLIQVLERRTADMSSERRRIEARKALLDRKGDEAYQEWLRQLRDRAYIEMRLEERLTLGSKNRRRLGQALRRARIPFQ